jgi:lipoate-protein ligase A
MNEWRLIADDGVSDSFGLAADEALAVLVGSGASPPTLRLYTYRSTCALVGRFQNVENELHIEHCRADGVPINRRPTGGGAIIMGADQLGIALTIPGRREDSYSRARELMEQFSEGIVRGAKLLGVDAQFRRKNDIEVNGRKMVGLGIYRAPTNGQLFHASLLVDLDVPLMLRILNTPFEKISDKEISVVAARTTTVRRELNAPISLDDVRVRVAQGYAAAFGVNLAPGYFAADELQAIADLERAKYSTDDWVYQTTQVPDAFGSAKVKTPAGLLDVGATLAGRTLKAVYIRGDFFAAENAIADIEAGLRWHPADPDAIAATLNKAYGRWQNELNQIPAADLVQAVQTAVQRASIVDAKARSDPYGCFVNPQGGE